MCLGYSLVPRWGSKSSLSVATKGIFAIWWANKYDHYYDADLILSVLASTREDCLTNLGMFDPPNPGKGYYYNVYIHHYKDDLFPDHWWIGQASDEEGLPYIFIAYDYINTLTLNHEAFHIFQFSSNSPGKEPKTVQMGCAKISPRAKQFQL